MRRLWHDFQAHKRAALLWDGGGRRRRNARLARVIGSGAACWPECLALKLRYW